MVLHFFPSDAHQIHVAEQLWQQVADKSGFFQGFGFCRAVVGNEITIPALVGNDLFFLQIAVVVCSIAILTHWAKVWWVGEKFPSTNKGIIAAVHAGRRPGKGFRSKVVVLKEAAEAPALAAALKRAAQPKDAPLMHDSWGRPIAFEGFPLLPTGNAPIVDLAALAARATPKVA